MEEKKSTERRKYVRLDVRTKINFQVQDRERPDIESIPTLTKNLSVKGVCFIFDKKIEPGTILKLEILLPGHTQPLHFVGQVRWSEAARQQVKQEGQKEMFDIGVKFFIIDKNDVTKFVDYICDRAFDEARKNVEK